MHKFVLRTLAVFALFATTMATNPVSAQERNLLGRREIVQDSTNPDGTKHWRYRNVVRTTRPRATTQTTTIASPTPTPVPAPIIHLFDAENREVGPGESTKIRYRVENAREVELINDSGQLVTRNDQSPQWGDYNTVVTHENTTFTLVAKGSNGQRVEKQITLGKRQPESGWPSPWWLLLIGLPLLAIAGTILYCGYRFAQAAQAAGNTLFGALTTSENRLWRNVETAWPQLGQMVDQVCNAIRAQPAATINVQDLHVAAPQPAATPAPVEPAPAIQPAQAPNSVVVTFDVPPGLAVASFSASATINPAPAEQQNNNPAQ
jgi:hypothetical protein